MIRRTRALLVSAIGSAAGVLTKRRARRLRWGVALLLCLFLLPCVALVVRAAFEPLPAPLRDGDAPSSLRVLDRHGRLLRELRTRDGRLSSAVTLAELSPWVEPALLAAEDARFYWHPGVDPLAVARAAWQGASAFRVVSGASTLTQQLARNVSPRPRTFAGKFREMALALRIEASLGKQRILEEYLSRIEFGPNLVGIEVASRHYFDKPAKVLDMAEAATLVALVRGPTLYDPRRAAGRLRERRDWVLRRMLETGAAPDEAVEVALQTELHVRRGLVEGGSLHLAFALASGRLLSQAPGAAPIAVRSTLDAGLQREVEAIARRAGTELSEVDATGVAVLVVDNASSEVLAYVGSPDYFARGALGGNDGTRALRQPGSALKPFVYAAAMQHLGWDAATLLPDLGLELSTPQGRYLPRNYDGREHGPVRLRVALASSLNLPALYTTERVGPSAVLELLHRFGFDSLRESAAHYGASLALGDGEVRLSELAAAYAALAREGEWRALVYAREITRPGRAPQPLPAPPSRRVLPVSHARILTHMLADDAARIPAFGRSSLLKLPFPAAAKTGTSKGYRDNWAVGYTPDVTVAVWVGNFDGKPMVGSSGISGAGPVLHATLLAAMRGREVRGFSVAGLVGREVCELSGQPPSPSCAQRIREYFEPGQPPQPTCAYHETVKLDPHNGLRASAACHDAREQRFERYPELYASWARASGRPLAPTRGSPRCPPAPAEGGIGAARIEWPREGASFVRDVTAGRQEIVVRASAGPGVESLTLLVDGQVTARSRPPFRFVLPLTRGTHELRLAQAHALSVPVRIEVKDGLLASETTELFAR